MNFFTTQSILPGIITAKIGVMSDDHGDQERLNLGNKFLSGDFLEVKCYAPDSHLFDRIHKRI